ncbi:YihY/virulence factor BrkB family protein [Polaromonas hydrogenivorans]|uniref:YihY/virulence factor BrkB family protein n=1 Tax=Polaromonas hydrogenivorans TaxID=335476 RepID=A0AAU7LMG5_9BURK
MNFNHFYALVKKSVMAWIDDYAPSMGAAISYYTVFSIAPLMIIVIAVAGFVWGREAVQGEIVGQLSGLIGKEGAQGVQALIESANQPTQGLVATAISIVVLVIGATTVFAELQSSLDRIWQVPKAPKISGLWAILRSRLLSFGFILGLGFLLLVSLVSNAAIAALGSWASRLLPGWESLLYLINTLFSLGVATVLFAMIFKVMPQAKIGWRDVWTGAGVTAVLFEVGKWLISLYIGKSSVTSSFAAAGSLVVLLVWVYYSAQIFLLGAEFTWVYANAHGSLAGAGKAADAPSSTMLPAQQHDAPIAVSQPQPALPNTPGTADVCRPALSGDPPGHASLKQRAIVYAGSAAAFLALRLLLKYTTRRRI